MLFFWSIYLFIIESWEEKYLSTKILTSTIGFNIDNKNVLNN